MKAPLIEAFMWSERERIRTFDRLLRRQMLYPAELRTLNVFFKVGAAGFEPATSWSQTRRDDRTTLRPEGVISNEFYFVFAVAKVQYFLE